MVTIFGATNQNCSWVTYIGTENFVAYNEYRDTRATWESQIQFTVLVECILHSYKSFGHLFFYLCWIDDSLLHFSQVKSLFDVCFDIWRKCIFYPVRDFTSEYTVTVTDCKKVSSTILTQVRQDQILVLIYLMWIFRAESSFCCKGELCYTVVKLFSSDFLSYSLLVCWRLCLIILIAMILWVIWIVRFLSRWLWLRHRIRLRLWRLRMSL